ncbi:putative exodeoxyribonuclease V alpha chain recD [Chlamydiales bacterium STE3]|nr:putative exodeoxyribonuclease V alpha chain recD [Chlamydiales bacterium STE3]
MALAAFTTFSPNCMMNKDLFNPIETALAERMLDPYPQHRKAAFFIKTLLLAAKKGHLCLYIDEKRIEPSLNHFFEELEQETKLRESLAHLPSDLWQEWVNDAVIEAPICRRGNYYYFQRYFLAEKKVFNEWQRLNAAQPAISCGQLPESEEGLLAEQYQAIQLACAKSFVILSGGPGTGKTFTAGRMIKTFLKTLMPEVRKNYRIALAAPTGKAAAHLEQSLTQAFADDPHLKITGKTLHNLLSIGKLGASKGFLPYDFIVVDESSMIDVELMAALLSSVQSGTRLILIGDENQLPPVEAGGVFADLKAIHPHAITLSKCLRAELKELVDFGKHINNGRSQEALALMNSPSLSRIDPEKVSFKALLEEVAQRFLSEENKNFCILTPLRQGPFGNDAINQLIASALKKKARGAFRAPIMIAVNDHKQELFNGELGFLEKQNAKLESLTIEDFAYFPNERKFYALLLPRFEYAYCLSVHKSQGSEFEEILLILPEGSEHFGRKVIYTAVTRAKKKMTIYGTEAVLKKTLEANVERLSGIRPLA